MKRILALCSFGAGLLFNIPLPRWLRTFAINVFSTIVGANPAEAALPLDEYGSLGAFFIRDLKAGVRPLGSDIVSPADSTLRSQGEIRDGTIKNVKGTTYTVTELIGDAALAKKFSTGYHFNLYLSPKDYHHVHSPLEGKILEYRFIPGLLLPVNSLGMLLDPNFQAHNERVVIILETTVGLVAVVMVGALNVGKISLTFDSLVTNLTPWRDTFPYRKVLTTPLPCEKGARLGTFHLGSSVVLLFESKNGGTPLSTRSSPCSIKMGETLQLV